MIRLGVGNVQGTVTAWWNRSVGSCGVFAVLCLALPLGAEETEFPLGERVYFPTFSLSPPQGWEGPEIQRKRPVTYVTWKGPERSSGGQALFQLAVTDVAAAPSWIGYDSMTIGELTDHFVRELARKTIGLKSEAMEEVDINGVRFRRVRWQCQMKNNAMQLVEMKGYVMATRNGAFLYTMTAQDLAEVSQETLPWTERSAESFRWIVQPADPTIPAALPVGDQESSKP